MHYSNLNSMVQLKYQRSAGAHFINNPRCTYCT